MKFTPGLIDAVNPDRQIVVAKVDWVTAGFNAPGVIEAVGRKAPETVTGSAVGNAPREGTAMGGVGLGRAPDGAEVGPDNAATELVDDPAGLVLGELVTRLLMPPKISNPATTAPVTVSLRCLARQLEPVLATRPEPEVVPVASPAAVGEGFTIVCPAASGSHAAPSQRSHCCPFHCRNGSCP